MRMFRLLRPDEIECRISEINKDGKFLKLLLYKTARTDACLLDETVGADRWQNDYKTIDGKMYCGIGIWFQDMDQWIWKWNVGTESNTEEVKGEASDALKRAGFVWGLGTELYSSPEIKVWPNKCEIKDGGGKKRCYDNFEVSNIEYDKQTQEIISLAIMNTTRGVEAFSWAKEGGTVAPARNTRQRAAEAPRPARMQEEIPFTMDEEQSGPMTEAHAEPAKEPVIKCTRCGEAIRGNKKLTVNDIASRTIAKFGYPYCLSCASKKYEEESNNAE